MKRYIPLGDVISKSSVERCGEREFPILSITMKDGLVLQDEKFKKRIASIDTSDYKVIPRGKLVQGIHIDEANFGIQDIVDAGIVSPAYKVWNINTDLVHPKYLEIIMRSPRSIAYYSSKLNGSVNRRGRMTDNDFLSMPIPYAEKHEQIKIIYIINRTKQIIRERQTLLDYYDTFIKARFVEMFGESDYPQMLLNDVIVPGAGLSYGIIVPGDYFKDGCPMVRPSDYQNGKLDLRNVYRVNPEIEAKYSRTRLQGNEILVQVIGQPGQIIPATEECKGMNVTRNLAVVRPNMRPIIKKSHSTQMEKTAPMTTALQMVV